MVTKYTLSREQRVNALRGEARALPDGGDDEIVLLALAEYLEQTAEDMGTDAIMEIAMAYVEGYEHGRGAHGRVPGVWKALNAAGLRR